MRFNPIVTTIKRIWSAVSSRSRAAYLGLIIMVIGPFTRLFDAFGKAKSDDNIDEVPPCAMVVCTSRSGGTIVYQVLTRIIPCIYVSNLHTLLPHGASQRLKRNGKLGRAPFRSRNYFGYTASLYDVNEGNGFMQSLFKGDPDRAELRRRFIRWAKQLGASKDLPLIFKNVWAYDKVGRLQAAVPELNIIRLTRNPELVAQSSWVAYGQLGYYNPIPVELMGKPYESVEHFGVHQLLTVEAIMDDQVKGMPTEKFYPLTYEEFCSKTEQHLRQIADLVGVSEASLRRTDDIPTLKASNKQKVSDERLAKIKGYIQSFRR